MRYLAFCVRALSFSAICAVTAQLVLADAPWVAGDISDPLPPAADAAQANTAAVVKSALSRGPIPSRQNVFGIPFQVNRNPGAADVPVLMRLYVSRGPGEVWGLAQEVDPGAGTFMFRAPEDGLYHFSLRSVDRSGNEHPAGPHEAGLRVEVDTQPPELALHVERGAAGEVEIRWDATDVSLDNKSLSISYQTNPYEQSTPLAISQPDGGESASQRGTAHWWPQQNSSEIFLRAEVADRAGNRSVQLARLPKFEPASAAVPPPTQNASIVLPMSQPLDRSAESPGGPAGAQNWSPDSVSGLPLQGPLFVRPESPAADNLPRSQNVAFQPSPNSTDSILSGSEPGTASPISAGVQAVNSHSFDIEYDLTAGPTTDVLVEVWMTRDSGRHWTRQGVDTDRKSPAQVRVDADGVYGFRIMVQSPRGGLVAPQPGGRPETTLLVDTRRPELQLLGVTSDPEAGPTIRWYSKDQDSQEVTIDLFYASNPAGPWEPISRGIANSGAFVWQAAKDLPEWVYVRVEAADAAGNRNSAMTNRPVQIQPNFRSARILQIRPTRQAQSPANASRY